MKPRHCIDCPNPLPPGGPKRGLCSACKALTRVLRKIRGPANTCAADVLTKPARVEQYERIVAAGGRLFEGIG